MNSPDTSKKRSRTFSGGFISGLGLGLVIAGFIIKNGYTTLPWSGFIAFGIMFMAGGATFARSQSKSDDDK